MKTKLGVLILLLAAAVAPASTLRSSLATEDGQTNTLTALLQQGLFEEQANRNLDAAISDYQTLAAQFDKNRSLAATAIFRLGECYRAQGRTNEAAAQYQRILREFPDQQTLATLSRQDLAGLGVASPSIAGAPTVSDAARQQQRQLLEEEMKIVEQKLEALQTNVDLRLAPKADLLPTQQELLELKRQLAALETTAPQAALPENFDAKLWDRVNGLSIAELEKVLPTLVPDAVLTKLQQQRDDTETELAKLHTDYNTNTLNVVREEVVLKTIDRQISERISGIMQALKLRAEASLTSVAASAPIDDEDQEIRRIQEMIQNSPDLINAPSGSTTPLVKAAYNGWLRVATYLLDHGADVNAYCSGIPGVNELLNANGPPPRVTPLFAAVLAGNRAMTELLIGRGADMNFKGPHGDTPLHLAVQKGFQAVTEVLIEHKADVNALNYGKDTPLYVAVQNGNPEIVSLLLAHQADVNLPNVDGETPLFFAARGNLNIASMLLAAGANPNLENNDGRTPLSYAAASGSSEIVKSLLAAKADPNGGKLDAPLLVAIHKQDAVCTEMLLQAGAKPNLRGMVHWQVSYGSYNYPSGTWVTPMFLASTAKQLPLVQMLLKFKADPNDTQTDNQSPLFSVLDKPEIVRALLDAGARAEATKELTFYPRGTMQTYHESLLQEAAYQNQSETVELLLQHGANPEIREEQGNSVLHYAVWALADEKVFTLLLASGANPNVRNNDGQTPLGLAKEAEQNGSWLGRFDSFTTKKAQAEKLIALLRQHGALDVLPNWDRITVSRPSTGYSAAILYKGTNDWNQFTLFDLLGIQYDLLTASTTPVGGGSRLRVTPYGVGGPAVENSLTFPDFTRIIIHRPSARGTNWTELKINLARALNSGDCAADVPLQFGDVVEIPEADHVINEPWMGLSTNELFTLKNCLTRRLQITVNGQTTNLTIAPQVEMIMPGSIDYIRHPPRPSASGSWEPIVSLLEFEPFTIWPVLENSKLLLASSDLSRVQVKRRDAATGKRHEWTVDCSDPNAPPDFWLRDGDVIEVPGK